MLDTNEVLNANQWYHLAIVHNSTQATLYVDGIKPAQTFQISNNITKWFNSVLGIDNGRIGAYNFNNGGNSNYFKGSIDDIMIYNRALSASQILYTYNEQMPKNVTYIDSCQELAGEGKFYGLSKSIENNTLTDNCMNITASGIILDCQGYSITSNNSVSGIFSDQVNITIENCVIDMGPGGKGIELFGANNSMILDNSISSTNIGLLIDSAFNATIKYNSVRLTNLGMHLAGSQNSTVEYNTFTSNEDGLRVDQGSINNIINYNTICPNFGTDIYCS